VLLEYFNWELFDHLPYGPDFALCNYHLYTYLTNWLRSQYCNNNGVLMEGTKWGRVHRQHTSLTQGHKNLRPGTTASMPALRSSLSVFFIKRKKKVKLSPLPGSGGLCFQWGTNIIYI
jgi:hypothetical protein